MIVFIVSIGALAGLATRLGVLAACIAVITGCATVVSPKPLDQVPFKERMQEEVRGALIVRTAVPTRDEAASIYGVDLGRKGMQAVWVEVKNDSGLAQWLLPSGLDPSYFSVAEAAYAFHPSADSQERLHLEEHFRQLEFPNPVMPGVTESGFVIVHREEAFKVVDIDLVARGSAESFTFIVLDPSFKGDYTLVDVDKIYQDDEMIDIETEEALRAVIEQLPCCTTNKHGDKFGDPLNLVLIGDNTDIFTAFVRRGWHGTEILWSDAVWRTVKSFIQGSRYRYSPVSPLYVYGRRQEIALQKARGTIHERNHLRVWLTPIRFQGESVWIGQISRDIGVKFTLKSPTISTHVIDPDVDEARRYLMEDMAYSQALVRLGFVGGVGKTSKAQPDYNLVGDPWFTDGRRAVMFFEPRPATLADIDVVEAWESPAFRSESSGDEPSGSVQ
jgi:hypothetical protein